MRRAQALALPMPAGTVTDQGQHGRLATLCAASPADAHVHAWHIGGRHAIDCRAALTPRAVADGAAPGRPKHGDCRAP